MLIFRKWERQRKIHMNLIRQQIVLATFMGLRNVCYLQASIYEPLTSKIHYFPIGLKNVCLGNIIHDKDFQTSQRGAQTSEKCLISQCLVLLYFYVCTFSGKLFPIVVTLCTWLILNVRRIQDMLCTINNCLSNKAPPSIKNLVSSRSCSYNLRGENMLALPKVNTTKYGLKSWRYFATKIWNDLPNEIRATAGKNEFVRRIRTVNF